MSDKEAYHQLDFTPPEEAADAAEKGLTLRSSSGHGGTEIGVARARDLKNRRTCSPDTVNRMVSYFARHEVDKQADDFGNDDEPSAGYVAWLLWGGDPGRKWAEKIKQQMKEADEQQSNS